MTMVLKFLSLFKLIIEDQLMIPQLAKSLETLVFSANDDPYPDKTFLIMPLST